MLSSYTNPEIIVYKKKEETLNISKENSDITPSNGSYADNKNGAERKSMTEFGKKLHLSNEQFDEFARIISQKTHLICVNR